MADTRMPFNGCSAFDRNSQKYIPFSTQSDAMIASLMLAYRLASPILSVVLAVVRHPQFNPAEVTLHGPQDIWAKVAEHDLEAAGPSVNRCQDAPRPRFPFHFPHFVVEEVVDILNAEREQKLHAQRDMHGPQLDRITPAVLDKDLRNMSLVRRSWTLPAQRAMGRILTLQNVKINHLQNALNGPLFGTWTREIIIFRSRRSLDEAGRDYSHTYGNEIWKLMGRLLMRVPNVRLLCHNSDWFEVPVSCVTDEVPHLPSLRELRLVHIGDITQLLGVVLKKIGKVPNLQHLSLQYSGTGSVYSSYVPQSDLTGLSPPPTLERLSLKIGSASQLSLNYLNWLCQPRRDEFKLKNLALDLSSCYHNEVGCVRALEPAFGSLESLSILVSGLSDGILSTIFSKCLVLRRLAVVMRHFFTHTIFLALPTTIEEVCADWSYFEETAEWDEWDRRVRSFLSRGTCPALRKCVIRVPFYDPYAAEKIDGKFIEDVADRFRTAAALAVEKGISFRVYVSSNAEYQRNNTHVNHSWM